MPTANEKTVNYKGTKANTVHLLVMAVFLISRILKTYSYRVL